MQTLETKLGKTQTKDLVDEINKGINFTEKDYRSHVDKALKKFKIKDPALTDTIARQVRPFAWINPGFYLILWLFNNLKSACIGW